MPSTARSNFSKPKRMGYYKGVIITGRQKGAIQSCAARKLR